MNLLDRLRELERAATPGPWNTGSVPPDKADEVVWTGDALGNHPAGTDGRVCVMYEAGTATDAELIALARNTLPLLLDVVENGMRWDRAIDDGDPAQEQTARLRFRKSLSALEEEG